MTDDKKSVESLMQIAIFDQTIKVLKFINNLKKTNKKLLMSTALSELSITLPVSIQNKILKENENLPFLDVITQFVD